jgi:hypothetical protein
MALGITFRSSSDSPGSSTRKKTHSFSRKISYLPYSSGNGACISMVSSSSFNVNSLGLFDAGFPSVVDGTSSSDDDALTLDSLELFLPRRLTAAI